MNLAICINGLEIHLLCLMQFCLNGMHISEVPTFLAESPSVTSHLIMLTGPFNTAHQQNILHQLSSVNSYFDVYSLSIAEYENQEIPKIYLTAEGPQ